MVALRRTRTLGSSIPRKKLSSGYYRLIGDLYSETDYWKPKTRADCTMVERPCPYVLCRYHLYLDIGRSGNLKFNFPGLEVWEMGESCVLDVADRGGATFDDVGAAMNLVRERIHQIECEAIDQVRNRGDLVEFAPEGG